MEKSKSQSQDETWSSKNWSAAAAAKEHQVQETYFTSQLAAGNKWQSLKLLAVLLSSKIIAYQETEKIRPYTLDFKLFFFFFFFFF